MDHILVRGIRLWAHVGVLDEEREHGQWFEVDICLNKDMGLAGALDDIHQTLDYSPAIAALQLQARSVNCLTIECWSDHMLLILEELYGPVPMALELRKCCAPVHGFAGTVAVRRHRRGGFFPGS